MVLAQWALVVKWLGFGKKVGFSDLRQDCWHYMAVQFIHLDAGDLQAPELKMM